MNVSYEKLESLINSSTLEDYTDLEFEGLVSRVIYDENNSGLPAEYHHMGSHVEIYMWESIPKQFRAPIVMHGIASMALRETYFDVGMSSEQAARHSNLQAHEFVERYAQRNFNQDELHIYNEFNKMLKTYDSTSPESLKEVA